MACVTSLRYLRPGGDGSWADLPPHPGNETYDSHELEDFTKNCVCGKPFPEGDEIGAAPTAFVESRAIPTVIKCFLCPVLTHEECALKWWKNQVGFSEGRWRNFHHLKG